MQFFKNLKPKNKIIPVTMFYSKMQIENPTWLLNVLTKYQVIFL